MKTPVSGRSGQTGISFPLLGLYSIHVSLAVARTIYPSLLVLAEYRDETLTVFHGQRKLASDNLQEKEVVNADQKAA